MRTVIVDRNHLTIDAFFQHHGATIRTNVFAHQPMGGIHGHIADMFGTTVIGHFKAKLVIRIEYCGIVGDAHYGLFDARQLFQGFDTAQPHVIG